MPVTRPPLLWALVASLRLAGCARELRPQFPAPHHPTPAFAAPLLSKTGFEGGVDWRLDAGGMTRTQRRAGPSRPALRVTGLAGMDQAGRG
jgi:hypothetical protein